MIDSIYTGTGNHLTVSGYNNNPHISIDHNNPVSGMIRMNGSSFEVYNGNGWIQFGASAEVSLTGTAIAAIEWATKKMNEETKIRQLAANNVTIADALAKYDLAQEQLKMVLTLTDKQ